MTSSMKLDVHRHSYVSGPMARWSGAEIVHSHEGGDQPHAHEHTGPGCYTIDRDEWFAATGLRRGGRKKFTARPHGVQFPVIPREQTTFEIIFVGPHSTEASGPRLAPAHRLILSCKARVVRVRGVAS